MKPTSPALIALFATRQFYTAKLFTFTFPDGSKLRYCSGDQDITSGGHVFSAGGQSGPYFERGSNKAKAHWKIGMQVDSLVFDVLPGSSSILGIPFLQAVRWGLFDGVDLLYEKAYMPTYGDVSAGVYQMFRGRVGNTTEGRSIVTFTINSYLELTNQNMPTQLFQAGCNNVLYDTGCGLNPNAFKSSGVVLSGSTASAIKINLPGRADGFFDQGRMTVTSGALSGMTMGIRSWLAQSGVTGLLTGIMPFPSALALGVSLDVFAGCDLRQTTCTTKFNNLANFRGTPYVPVPETAV